MFTLGGNSYPVSSEEFRRSLADGLRIFGPVAGIVEMVDAAFPEIARLSIDLSEGRFPVDAGPGASVDSAEQGVRIGSFSVAANPLKLSEGETALTLDARNVAFEYGRSASGSPVLRMKSAESGTLVVSATDRSLEAFALAAAKKLAAKQDVRIEGVKLAFKSNGPRDVNFSAKISATKMIFTVVVNVTGRLHLDDSLTARISDLKCTGEGMASATAAELLRPKLAQLEGRTFSLTALPLGGIAIRDVEIDTGDPIRISAHFGMV